MSVLRALGEIVGGTVVLMIAALCLAEYMAWAFRYTARKRRERGE